MSETVYKKKISILRLLFSNKFIVTNLKKFNYVFIIYMQEYNRIHTYIYDKIWGNLWLCIYGNYLFRYSILSKAFTNDLVFWYESTNNYLKFKKSRIFSKPCVNAFRSVYFAAFFRIRDRLFASYCSSVLSRLFARLLTVNFTERSLGQALITVSYVECDFSPVG